MLRKALVFVLNIEKVGERVGQFLGPMCSFEVWSSSMAQVRILVVDDEPIFRRELATFLRELDFVVEEVESGEQALAHLREESWDILLLDLALPGMSGIEVLRQVSVLSPETVTMMLTAFASLETAIEALRLGAYDYLMKPIRFDALEIRLERLETHRQMVMENQSLKRLALQQEDFHKIVGESPAIQKVFQQIRQLRDARANVLISGESGVGKELVARAVHEHSGFSEAPFLPVNISAIPETMMESQLFGHKKGSFTGADRNATGIFQAARGGTVFLDEIGELPLSLQPRLLRAIEEKEIFPLGAEAPISVDFRLIAATNRNLEERVKQGKFREDLFYRLNVFQIEVPPLRERKEDIPLLVHSFVSHFASSLKKKTPNVSNEVMQCLLSSPWPGNVRELRNVIERSVILCQDDWITPELLPSSLQLSLNGESLHLKDVVERCEKEHISSVLRLSNNVKEQAAEMLGLSLATLYRRLEKYELLRPDDELE